MAAPETMTPRETSATLRRRSPSLLLPEEPSREELAQFWTLSDRDRAEVMRCQGEANQRRFAVQLCTLRTYGRFLPEATPAPVAITNYLARQLDLSLVLFGDIPSRLATETGHRQRILSYLGWQAFDEEARTRLTQWLSQRATEHVQGEHHAPEPRGADGRAERSEDRLPLDADRRAGALPLGHLGQEVGGGDRDRTGISLKPDGLDRRLRLSPQSHLHAQPVSAQRVHVFVRGVRGR